MRKISLFKIYTADQDAAIRFYVDKLGFELAEDKRLGDYRWVVIRLPDQHELTVNLELAKTPDEQMLVGRQAAGQPFFSITTDDCVRDYETLSGRGVKFEGPPQKMPFGTGAMMQDLYGNKIYMIEEPR